MSDPRAELEALEALIASNGWRAFREHGWDLSASLEREILSGDLSGWEDYLRLASERRGIESMIEWPARQVDYLRARLDREDA